MKWILIISTLLFACLPVQAAGTLSMHDFAKFPILHEGRIKPLSRFAAIELDKISGHANPYEPTAWLAGILFNPQYAVTQNIFHIADLLRKRMNLPERAGNLYSLQEISPFLEQTRPQAMQWAAQDRKDLAPDQRALMTLHENAMAYSQLLQSMTAFLPLEIAPPAKLNIVMNIYDDKSTYREISPKAQEMFKSLQKIIAHKGEKIDSYNEEESRLAALAFEYQTIAAAGEHNVLLRVIPAPWNPDQNWVSPWQSLNSGQSLALLNTWQTMAKAYRDHDEQAWQTSTAQAYRATLNLISDKTLAGRLQLEILYNQISPFKIAFGFYALALMLAGCFIIRPHRLILPTALTATGLGMLAHISGIIMRIMILGRPPVGSLYESLLFVSLIIMAGAFFIECKRRDLLALLSGTAATILILFLVPLLAPSGDDLEMLVAVLNTNFWLATHVICITSGYGVCILTAMLAHLYLFQRRTMEGLFKNIYILSLISLLLTCVGTVLGGIWADQSWGRFWGWDPKENGALLIVLWLIWLLHGKVAGQLNSIWFVTGLAALNIVVALSWFGVNLLSVGLHSYGFTSGLAYGLLTFCSAEALCIAILHQHARKNREIP